jgi:hypothetical protein
LAQSGQCKKVKTQTKNRLILIAVLLLFAAPLLIAFLLNRQGWHPQNTRNSGELVDPPLSVAAAPVTLAGGASKLVWRNPQWQWTLLALPGAHCETQCRTRVDEALRMRLTLGRNAERLRIVYLGPEIPLSSFTVGALVVAHDDADTFAKYRAQGDDSLALALVDPNGLLMLRYADGYSAMGVRSDIQRVFH